MHGSIALLAAGVATLAQAAPPEPWIFESGRSRLEVRLEGFRATLENGDALTGGYRRETLMSQRDPASGEAKERLGKNLWRPRILPGSASRKALADLMQQATARVDQAQGSQPSPSEALMIKHILHLAGELGERAAPADGRPPAPRTAVTAARPSEPAAARRESKAPAKPSRLVTPLEWAAIISKVAKASASAAQAPKAPAQAPSAVPVSSDAPGDTGSADARPASASALLTAPSAPPRAATDKAWRAAFKGGLIQALATGYDCRFPDGSILIGGVGRHPVLIVKGDRDTNVAIKEPGELRRAMQLNARAAAMADMHAWAAGQAAAGYLLGATAEDRLRARNLEAFMKDVKAIF